MGWISVLFKVMLRLLGGKVPTLVGTAVAAAAIGALATFTYSMLSAPTGLETLSGPLNYYQSADALARAQEGAESELLRYRAGLSDANAVRSRFDELQARFADLTRQERASTASVLFMVPEYETAVQQLDSVIHHAREMVATLPQHFVGADESGNFQALVVRVDQLHTPLAVVLSTTGDAETLRRDAMVESVRSTRQYLIAFIVVVLGATIATIMCLVAVFRRKQQLVAQQAAAIVAERDASLAARKSASAKNAFLGMLGHELRTPLQSILSVTDVLARRRLPEADAVMVRRLSLAAERLDSQMKDLTDYARLDAGSLKLRLELFYPGELVASLVEDAAVAAKARGLELESDLDGGEWPCRSDPSRIRQILGNLISNAIRYTPSGWVKVTLQVSENIGDQRLNLSVSDSGPGLPVDVQERVFQPFVQLDQSNSRVHDGAGIGLAIVKGLVELLGGWVSIKSTLGQGTTVTVSLPVEIARDAQSLVPQKKEQGSALEGRSMLIVDDSDSARESFGDMLHALGVKVDAVDSGAEALEALAESVYDVVLLDIQMPVMDGIEVARRIRRGRTMNRSVFVMGISAFSTALLPDDDVGLYHVTLQKPVRAAQLEEALTRLLQGIV